MSTSNLVCPSSLLCHHLVGSPPPLLDATYGDTWASVQGTPMSLVSSVTGDTYHPPSIRTTTTTTTDDSDFHATIKCLYDDLRIYLWLDIPGYYRCDNVTDTSSSSSPPPERTCAAVSTMMKMGRKATFMNMGGCPDATDSSQCAVTPGVSLQNLDPSRVVGRDCLDHMVDLGAHWQLHQAEQGTTFLVKGLTGRDAESNKDDSYAVSPFCFFDDHGNFAGNEWAGAWRHTNPTTGEFGHYHFELSRRLSTNSQATDLQIGAGQTVPFGIAFWDPYQRGEAGWTPAGHYVSGCGSSWMDLTLAIPATEPPQRPTPTCPLALLCKKTDTPPSLDGTSEPETWGDDGILTSLVNEGLVYSSDSSPANADDLASIHCLYDNDRVYFKIQVPGSFPQDATVDGDQQFPALAVMMKMGKSASFVNVGGCPEALNQECTDAIPEGCNDYLVDVGVNWRLANTEQGQLYGYSGGVTGRDQVGNKDDSYGVSPTCIIPDNGLNAGNEWATAWKHSTNQQDGYYQFELSRRLGTASNTTDLQLKAGDTVPFGVAFWDQTTDAKWDEARRYVSGCGSNWISLVLVDPNVADGQDLVNNLPGPPVCPMTMTCSPLKTNPPTLDGNLDDWQNIPGISTGLVSSSSSSLQYDETVTLYCSYDENRIYLAMDIPGTYRFNADDDRQCAAIATMMKIGSKASFVNMGGCPEVKSIPNIFTGETEWDCSSEIIEACEDYLVDIGAHWQLKTTEQGQLYGINGLSGDDDVANKDDLYAVHSYCSGHDDGSGAGNEWAGAWSHTQPVDGAAGNYRFELSRRLSTTSTSTDVQLSAGDIVPFGFSFWDPFESDSGWSPAGHYLTGCGAGWIDLHLAVEEVVLEDTSSPICPKTLKCERATGTTQPRVDGSLDEWATVDGIESSLVSLISRYDESATFKCSYDDTRIYFAMDIPGEYRCEASSDKLCPAVGTMMKLGSKANYINMGGCPDNFGGCEDPTTIPGDCFDYVVDIGGHWKFHSQEQGLLYSIEAGTAHGEYGVSSYCGFNGGGFETVGLGSSTDIDKRWQGAWSHTNPVEGEAGRYQVEISRLLKTSSTVSGNLTDAQQIVSGSSYQIGFAFWDPLETVSGWSAAGHFMTGCGSRWIDLEVVPFVAGGNVGDGDRSPTSAPAPPANSSGQRSSRGISLAVFVCALVYHLSTQ